MLKLNAYSTKLKSLLLIVFCAVSINISAQANLHSKPANKLSPPIPVRFILSQAGFVTLVIEKPAGVRVRNLISEKWFPAGNNVAWWDALDDLGRDAAAANRGVYSIPAHFVEPGEYRVRGLFHKAIVPRYQFSVYSTGNPPWDLENHTGAWLANHTPPQSAVYIPANRSPNGQPAIYLGCYITEGPDGLAWLDLNGRKIGGKKWIGGAWTAAPFMAMDAGENADRSIVFYVASVWETGKNSGNNELRVTGLAKVYDKPILLLKLDSLETKFDKSVELGGIAVHNNIAVVSLTKRNELLFVDVTQRKVLGNIAVPSPSGLTFDSNGRLLVLSSGNLLRYNTITSIHNVPAPEQFTNLNLESPYGITTDQKGNIYISDDGNSNQVKIFDANGKFLSAIGKLGPVRAGPYDPLHMNNPAGIAIDSKNHLWVTEQDFLPKRVSVWTLDGRLINAFYGPSKYGGGGTVDSRYKNKFYYADQSGAMEFKLDWRYGTYKPERVYYRPSATDLQLPYISKAPETPVYYGNRRYFTDCYNSSPTGGAAASFLFIDTNGIARPIAGAGIANYWNVLKDDKFNSRWPVVVNPNGTGARDLAFFIWTDNNADGQVQPEEVTIIKAQSHGVTIMPDLSFCIAGLDNQAVRFAPVSVNSNGVPQYDMDKFEVLATGVLAPASTGGDQVLMANNGNSVITLGVKPYSALSISGVKNGVQTWSYPDMWPGLHASHQSPVTNESGELTGTTKLLGGFFTIKGSDAGQCWAINGNEGTVYLFTSDGLFITTLFSDHRKGKIWVMPVAKRGMRIDSISLGEENFFPSITQSSNDSIYMVDGFRSAVISFDGLESVRRLTDFTISVTNNDLVKANDYFLQTEETRQKTISKSILNVEIRSAPPRVDGRLDDWAGVDWAVIEENGVREHFNSNAKPYNIAAAAIITDSDLYVAYQTDIKRLVNSGEAPTAPFTTGDALDLMIGANPLANPDRQNPVEGDIRLVITMVNNRRVALLYKAVVKEALPADKTEFSSPSRTITFDKVDDISYQIQFASNNGDYEVSIPLSVLGLKPKDGMLVKADIGIIHGESGQAINRMYWSNKSTGINADIPSEAQLTPHLWGTWKIKSQ